MRSSAPKTVARKAEGAGPSPARCERSSLTRAACAISLALAAGCATVQVQDPLTRSLAGNEPQVRSEFWYQLARRPLACNDEAFHALLLYRNGTDPAETFDGRVRALVDLGMLPADFSGRAADAVDRGTLAVAVDKLLDIKGGVTMKMFGTSPRYALRAAVDRGLFPRSTPNQTLSGGELVAVMQKVEEYERGDPADGPASQLPDQVHPIPVASATVTATPLVYLDDILGVAATAPSTTRPAVGGATHLKAVVVDVQGDLVELRTATSPTWRAAEAGMVIQEGTEIRTGAKSAIRFVVPADEAFCLDSQGAVTLRQAVLDGRSAKTRLDLAHGRLREDLSHEGRVRVPVQSSPQGPVRIEEAGLEHDTVIQSPTSALALRGTKVSLYEQPSFAPVAISLTGRAFFTNTAGMRVAFGAADRRHVVIVGNQTSAAQQADLRERSLVESGNGERQAFETREQAIVSQRGGFRRGDVIVGDLHLADFGTRAGGAPNLPGALDFVLQWSGTAAAPLNDLNLAVFSPLHSAGSPDFVANPPFAVSLTPNSPTSIATRKAQYPRTSRSGGQITANSVGPDGLELAFWPKNYPTGTYRVRVFDLADASPPPTATVNPVSYAVSVYRAGDLVGTFNGTIGQLQTSPTIAVPIPAAAGASVRKSKAGANVVRPRPRAAHGGTPQ